MKTALNEKTKLVNDFSHFEISRKSQTTVLGGEKTETAEVEEEIE